MKKKIMTVAIAFFMGLGLSGCSGGKTIINGQNMDDAVKGSGVMSQSEVSLEADTYSITLGGGNFINFSGTLTIDESFDDKIVIETDDNVLELFSANVDNAGKNININFNSQKLYSDVKAKITVGIPVDSITASGVYNIVYNNSTAGNMNVELSGTCSGNISGDFSDAKADISGTATLSMTGSADKLSVNVSGTGNFSGSGFQTKEAVVNVSGVAGAVVCVSDKLDVTAEGTSSVDYIGSPEITESVSAAAKLNKKG